MLTIYTDGACSGNPGPAGAAMIVLAQDAGGSHKIIASQGKSLGRGTNQIAELEGALLALDFVLEHSENCINWSDRAMPVTVRCDSKYVVSGINEWMAGWIAKGWRSSSGAVANLDLWKAINDKLGRIRVSRGQRIEFQWVKGHAGDAWNNRVDEIAVAAASRRPSEPVAADAVAWTGKPADRSVAAAAPVARDALGLSNQQWLKLVDSLVGVARGDDPGAQLADVAPRDRDLAEIGARRALAALHANLEIIKKGQI